VLNAKTVNRAMMWCLDRLVLISLMCSTSSLSQKTLITLLLVL